MFTDKTNALALVTFTCLPLFGCPTTTPERPHSATAVSPICDTCAIIPPLNERDAFRVIARQPHAQAPVVIENGSIAAHAMLRLSNQIDHSGHMLGPHQNGQIDSQLIDLAPRLARVWMGRDGIPWTRDDRPFNNFNALVSKARLSPLELGKLLNVVRETPSLLPREPLNWVLLEGHPVTRREAAHLLAALNRCPIDELDGIIKLSRRVTTSLTQRRPFTALDDLLDAPGVNRRLMIRLHHQRHKLTCSGLTPPHFDHLEQALETHPILSRLQWVFTPSHVDLLLADIRARPLEQHADAIAQLNHLLTATPFALFAPQAPAPEDTPRQRREAAAEAVAEAVWRYEGSLSLERLAPCLKQLRLKEAAWVRFEQHMRWQALGKCGDLEIHVTLDLKEPREFVVMLSPSAR